MNHDEDLRSPLPSESLPGFTQNQQSLIENLILNKQQILSMFYQNEQRKTSEKARRGRRLLSFPPPSLPPSLSRGITVSSLPHSHMVSCLHAMRGGTEEGLLKQEAFSHGASTLPPVAYSACVQDAPQEM